MPSAVCELHAWSQRRQPRHVGVRQARRLRGVLEPALLLVLRPPQLCQVVLIHLLPPGGSPDTEVITGAEQPICRS